MKHFVLPIITLFLMTACNQTVVNPPTNPVDPTPIGTTSPSVGPTSIPQATVFPTPSPNATSAPSPQATAVPTPTVTPKPTIMPTSAPSSTQPTSTRTIVQVPLGTDLSKVFSSLKSNTLYVLAKGNWTVNGTFTVTSSNVGINFGGSTIALIPAAGASSNFVNRGSHLELYNGTIARCSVFVHSYADHLYLHELVFNDITFGSDGKQNAGTFQVYTADNNGATDNTIENIVMGHVGTVGIYNSADNFTLKNSTLNGSYGEYCFRSEITSDASAHRPNNTLIDHVNCDNTVNKFGKSCIGIRMGGTGIVIQNSTINGSPTTSYMNIGQGKPGSKTSPGSNVAGITIRNNHFMGQRVPQLEIDTGGILTVDSNIFDTPATMGNIAIAEFNTVTLTNNIRNMVPPGTLPLKKFWNTIFVGPSAPRVTESGTIVK